jgi:hypothetical protein
MVKRTKPCKCGSIEFISEPNRYDVYQIVDGVLELIESPFTEDEVKLFCRECGKELAGADKLVSE